MRIHKQPNESFFAFVDRAVGLVELKRKLIENFLANKEENWDKLAFVAVIKGLPVEAVAEAHNAALLKQSMDPEPLMKMDLDNNTIDV